jgi:hypothetical protein
VDRRSVLLLAVLAAALAGVDALDGRLLRAGAQLFLAAGLGLTAWGLGRAATGARWWYVVARVVAAVTLLVAEQVRVVVIPPVA